jgi:glycosyltransferase involved in cell wall biosynthesis
MSCTPDIILQDTNLPAHRMPNLYRAADCFVLPTRGEGWGRPYMEAMASGLPVIGANWSGNTAFMNAENSYLLDCKVIDVPEPAWREAPTFRGHRWAEPDIDQLRAHMRQAFTNREESRTIGRAARAHIAAHFSYDRVAAIIEEIVQESVPLASAA